MQYDQPGAFTPLTIGEPSRRPRKDGRDPPIPERLLARLWQKQAARREWFRASGGRRVRVLYPGRTGNSAGPDFRNALLEVEGVGLVQGDVEIHLRQRDWHSHGHATDPHYNGVVLHAALEVSDDVTSLQNGHQVPVVSLAPLLDEVDREEERESDCLPGNEPLISGLWALLERVGYPRPDGPKGMGELLDRAGDARFLGKSARFRRFLQEQSPEQTLYEALFEGLGYLQNRQPFLKLAARAPYAALERALRDTPRERRVEALESWLTRLSGLLPDEDAGSSPESPRAGPGKPLSPGAESAGYGLPRVGFGRPLDAREWHCFRVRPANHPRRRIAGGARLLARFMDAGTNSGFSPGIVAALRRAAASGKPRDLIAALTVAADSATASRTSPYVGPGRAGDLAVNVALPFLHALATSMQETNGEETNNPPSYLGCYHAFGKLQENELTREMAGQLLDPAWGKVATSARRQQGLIHLHRLLTGAT